MRSITEQPSITTSSGEKKTYTMDHKPILGMQFSIFIKLPSQSSLDQFSLMGGVEHEWSGSGWSVTYDGDRTFEFDLENAASGLTCLLEAIQYTSADREELYLFDADKSKALVKQKIVKASIDSSISVPTGINKVALPFPSDELDDVNIILDTKVFISSAGRYYYQENQLYVVPIYCDLMAGVSNDDVDVYLLNVKSSSYTLIGNTVFYVITYI